MANGDQQKTFGDEVGSRLEFIWSVIFFSLPVFKFFGQNCQEVMMKRPMTKRPSVWISFTIFYHHVGSVFETVWPKMWNKFLSSSEGWTSALGNRNLTYFLGVHVMFSFSSRQIWAVLIYDEHSWAKSLDFFHFPYSMTQWGAKDRHKVQGGPLLVMNGYMGPYEWPYTLVTWTSFTPKSVELRAPLLVTGSERPTLEGFRQQPFPVVSVGIIESTLLENTGDTGHTCGSSQVGYDTLLDTQVKVRTNKHGYRHRYLLLLSPQHHVYELLSIPFICLV